MLQAGRLRDRRASASGTSASAAGQLDWNGEIKPGPLRDRLRLLLHHSRHRRPRAVRVSSRTTASSASTRTTRSRSATSKPVGDEPTGQRSIPSCCKMQPSHGHDHTIVNGISRIGYMTGGKAARWVDEDMADTFTGKAVAFIEQNKDTAVLPLLRHARHPRAARAASALRRQEPAAACAATSIVQFDWCVGEILDDARPAEAGRQHAGDLHQRQRPGGGRRLRATARSRTWAATSPPGRLRGGKYSDLRGRHARAVHRPLAAAHQARRLGRAGLPDRSARLLRRADRPEARRRTQGPDSFNVLPALLGESPTGRDQLVEHGHPRPSQRSVETGPRATGKGGKPGAPTELYNLADDIGETKNVAAQNPEIVQGDVRHAGEARNERTEPAGRLTLIGG